MESQKSLYEVVLFYLHLENIYLPSLARLVLDSYYQDSNSSFRDCDHLRNIQTLVLSTHLLSMPLDEEIPPDCQDHLSEVHLSIDSSLMDENFGEH